MIINRQMVQTLVDNLADKYPAAVKGVIPEKISLSLLQNILSGLVTRKRPVRNLIKIVEVLEVEAEGTRIVEELLDIIIVRLCN
ncbi:MAG TPA: FHIPEP family type III secretion protein [Mobilitalea sp.]|nr:FHIPEP family type III secretion protein [Mobilitalea sp.]